MVIDYVSHENMEAQASDNQFMMHFATIKLGVFPRDFIIKSVDFINNYVRF